MNQETPETNKKKQSLDLAALVVLMKPLATFFKRHLVLMFIILTLSALMYAVIMVNVILQQSATTSETTSSKYDTRFDQATIDKINALGNRSQTPAINLPSGRINPFSE